MSAKKLKLLIYWLLVTSGLSVCTALAESDDRLTAEQWAKVKAFEQQRIQTIDKVIGSVVAIYGEERQGGGSGVIIDPSGIALTNHHVIAGAGTQGWGGLADGQLYRWKLIGTDPGGDVSMIQLTGKDRFPFTPLGDSDSVSVGDWSLAMGNPFILAEDQTPTVTLGIVSGVKRYQPGAGKNQLVYGNCIQTDSSINPGNSGGPLFNMAGEVIGINGRGSFKERGRVNVGLGYAISANQIKNFIPDLLATKLVEHGTLDASFEDRKGKVVCANLFEDSRLYDLGVRPGDQLLQFEGEDIQTANQFTNLICTLPEDWPASLVLKQANGNTLDVTTRLYGLPYGRPKRPEVPNPKDQTPEEKEQIRRQMDMIDLLAAEPGAIRKVDISRKYANWVLGHWLEATAEKPPATKRIRVWTISDKIIRDGQIAGNQRMQICENGEMELEISLDNVTSKFAVRDQQLVEISEGEEKVRSLVEMKLNSTFIQAMGILAANSCFDLKQMGGLLLDGSDKALGRNAYRLKWLDDDQDPLFAWFSMEDDQGAPSVELLKISANIDCKHDSGGMTFNNWVMNEGLLIPSQRQQVYGLSEKAKLAFVTESVELKTVDRPMPKDKSAGAASANEESIE